MSGCGLKQNSLEEAEGRTGEKEWGHYGWVLVYGSREGGKGFRLEGLDVIPRYWLAGLGDRCSKRAPDCAGCYRVLLLVACSCKGGMLGWGVITFGRLCGLLVIPLLALPGMIMMAVYPLGILLIKFDPNAYCLLKMFLSLWTYRVLSYFPDIRFVLSWYISLLDFYCRCYCPLASFIVLYLFPSYSFSLSFFLRCSCLFWQSCSSKTFFTFSFLPSLSLWQSDLLMASYPASCLGASYLSGLPV